MADNIQSVRQLVEQNKKILIALMSRNLPPETNFEQLNALIEQEIFNFEYRCVFNPEIMECIPESIENAFRKTIMQGLSFDQDYGLIWMMTRKYETPERGKFKALECNKTVNGWISLYRMAGSLEDIKAPVLEYDPVTGYVTKVTITLITPRYSSGGEIVGYDDKVFEFVEADWKLWQKKSHMIKVTSGNPGNINTLNLSGENYWNYKPKPKNKDDVPTPDKPGGINPSFAITKCTNHALNRAKLSKNPYAKKSLFIEHKRYVDFFEEEDDINSFTVSKPIPDFPDDPPASPDEVQNPESPAKTEEKPAQAASGKIPFNEKQVILKEAEACNTGDEVLAIFEKYKAKLEKDEEVKGKIIAIGRERRQAPRNSKPEEPKPTEENKQTETEEKPKIDVNDL